jgi:GR25 family glycosyltransferase involved in LPS biosynthesis
MNIDINLNNKINEYFDMIDIIYWINLDRSNNRRKNMEYNLKHFTTPNKRIVATDAKLLKDDQLYQKFINYGKFNRTKTEYACLHSHLKTIDEFSNSPYSIALICEDDLSLEYVKFWDKKISEIINNAPKDWDIIMLNYVTAQKITELYTYNNNGKISSCVSYIINKNSAKKLINSIKKDNKYILYKNIFHTADDYIYSLLKTYVYKYPYFTYPDINDSTIEESHVNWAIYTKKIAHKNWQEKYNKSELKDIFYINLSQLNKILILLLILIIIIFLIIKYKKIEK